MIKGKGKYVYRQQEGKRSGELIQKICPSIVLNLRIKKNLTIFNI